MRSRPGSVPGGCAMCARGKLARLELPTEEFGVLFAPASASGRSKR